MSGEALVSLADYAEGVGKSLRTVQRWLADGQLPDARQDGEGRWWLPAAAERDMARRRTTSLAVVPGGELVLDAQPPPAAPMGRLVSLEVAADELGTTAGGVRRMCRDGLYRLGPYGPHGALRVWLPPSS